MSPDDLTAAQRLTLLTLMFKASPLPNTFIVDTAKISLKKAARDKLVQRGYLTVTGKPMVLELTEKGWAQAVRELESDPPRGVGGPGGTLWVLLDVLREHFDRSGIAPGEFFAMHATLRRTTPPGDASELETRIRKAYAELAPRAGAYVMLAALRESVGAAPADVDRTLLRLHETADVELIPEANQKTLTEDQRAAAIRIGNQDKHLIAIRS